MLCLTQPTDPRWLEAALSSFENVLADHAHCEMKAASNALALAARTTGWPSVVLKLVGLAEEELAHFRRVVAMLDARGIALGPPSVDPYAAELRRFSQGRPSPFRGAVAPLVDRMLVASLIEARSCERFRLLRDGLRDAGQADLATFYDELLAAEAGHFRVFVDLAVEIADGARAAVRERLALFADAEGSLAARLGGEPTIHG